MLLSTNRVNWKMYIRWLYTVGPKNSVLVKPSFDDTSVPISSQFRRFENENKTVMRKSENSGLDHWTGLLNYVGGTYM